MRSWFRAPRAKAPESIPGRRIPALRPTVEVLEDRCLLSFNVSTHVPGPNVNVSNLASYQGETTIAVNPTNAQNLVAGSNNLGSGGITLPYYSKNGGTSWTKSSIPGGQNGDPVVAFDRAGSAYMCY